jgi:hypothetical protein
MDDSGPDGYTVILKINSYVNISATSRGVDATCECTVRVSIAIDVDFKS